MPVHLFWRTSKAPDSPQRTVSPSRTGPGTTIKPVAGAGQPTLQRKWAISQMPLFESTFLGLLGSLIGPLQNSPIL